MDLAAFIGARLDEDEAAALDAGADRWEVRQSSVCHADGPPSLNPVASRVFDYAPHIARHDPARVLRQVAAGRAILAEHGPEHMCFENAQDGNTWDCHEGDCRIMRHLAAAWSDHPDYQPEWKPA